MRLHEVRSIEIEAPYEQVFEFIANRNQLPQWAEAFEEVDGARARMRTPNGAEDVDLHVASSLQHGTIDWTMAFADGSVATANSRLTPGSGGRIVYTFVLNAPPAPLEHLEGVLQQQASILEGELERLRALVSTL